MMPQSITASMLYNLTSCEHRLYLDTFGDLSQRGEPNAFIQLLWEKGTLFEKEVMTALDLPFLDLSSYRGEEKEYRTREAIEQSVPLIYSGRLSIDNLIGEPDLLRKEEAGYVAGDIKSGSGEEGDEDKGKLKKSYAVQLGLYTDILERIQLSASRWGFIWDIHGKEVRYDFTQPQGIRTPQTWWDLYQSFRQRAQEILEQQHQTQAAYSSATCKLCDWYQPCLLNLQKHHDLTLLPELGRAKRESLSSHFSTIQDFASADLSTLTNGKKSNIPGMGLGTLQKLHARAQLIAAGDDARPYLREPIDLPKQDSEIFFDIEVDPLRDHTYLHGFIERQHQKNATEQFVAFFADQPTAEAEQEAFAKAIGYLHQHPNSKIYYYSKYERTLYRKLQAKYPDVCTAEEIEALFNPERAIDLYFDVVLKATEWPTRDYSIKSLAKYLGFIWRDTHPSGAASIEWFHRWVESGDLEIKQRILDYNEDDCRATRVLLDGIRRLRVRSS
ncbi:MAG: TM0106 family RecB-like putative nuclease [Nitrospirales bacterium]|nr:TM0106 family RecB-like putative nuclease [Nitrospirales bacterium]